jgi:hypothetical protein
MRRRIVAAVVAATFALQPTAAEAAFATGKLQYGVVNPVMSHYHGARACTATSAIWLQELGSSGITRLRAEWELRSTYDPGYLPTYAKSGWAKSAQFPDDPQSRWIKPLKLSAGSLTFGRGRTFALWAQMVGERPSFWKPDVTRRAELGDVGCALLDMESEISGVPTGGGLLPGTPQIPRAGGR